MRLAFHLIVTCLGLILCCSTWAEERTEEAATEEKLSAVAAEAAESLEQAQESLAAWRSRIEAGEALQADELVRVKAALEKIYADFKTIVKIDRQRRRPTDPAKGAKPIVQRMVWEDWIREMRSIGAGAAEKRAETLAKIRDSLQGDDPQLQYAALRTLQAIGDVKYDKASMRPLVLPYVKTAKREALVAACYALLNTDRRPEDLELIHKAWQRRSPALDRSMTFLLRSFSDGKIEGRSEEIVLELLGSPQASVRREGLRGLWGASVTDQLAGRLIELADDPESHHDAIYFGLSTLRPKNPAAVDRLITELSDPDWNNWDRALWGLGYGIPEGEQAKVADALADMYVARSDPRTREKCRRLVRLYGGEQAEAALPK